MAETVTIETGGTDPVAFGPSPDAGPAPFGYEDDGRTPKAPYGHTKDGAVRRRPGRQAGPSRRSATGPKRRPAASRPSSKTRAASRASSRKPDYAAGVAELVNAAAFPLLMLGNSRPGPQGDMLVADAIALGGAADPIGQAVADLAHQHDAVAQVLDRILAAAPAAGLAAALVPLAAQLAANHGLVPPGLLGTSDPRELAAAGRAHMGDVEHQRDAPPAPDPSTNGTVDPRTAQAAAAGVG